MAPPHESKTSPRVNDGAGPSRHADGNASNIPSRKEQNSSGGADEREKETRRMLSALGIGRRSSESLIDEDEIQGSGGLISPHAEIFRSRLIEDFHLLDCISEQGKVEAPVYFPKDIQDDETRNKAMSRGPFKLVQFHRYSAADKLLLSLNDRRKNRIKNRLNDNPPLDMWAHWIIESKFFKNFMLILILVNSCFLGIQATMRSSNEDSPKELELFFDILDYCALIIFLVEIFLKWLDHFWNFWRNGWNIFDFIVTVFSIIPEIINFSSGTHGDPDRSGKDLANIADNLRVFRILRSLKMVTRFQQVRLIALAVAKAFKAMVFITLLLFTFMYIFAIFGVTLFDAYSESPREDLLFKSSFKSVLDAMATLFQLFTLDHWYAFYKDISKVIDPTLSGIYIVFWICIGSFIFRNIFVGIMVNNFQNIRNDLVHEIQEIEEAKQANIKLGLLGNELQKQDDKHREIEHVYKKSSDELKFGKKASSTSVHGTRDAPSREPKTPIDHDRRSSANLESILHNSEMTMNKKISQLSNVSHDEFGQLISKHIEDSATDSKMWQIMVMDNLDIIATNPIQTIWPRDTLFAYFVLMEHLMENLAERRILINLAAQALIQVHDVRGGGRH